MHLVRHVRSRLPPERRPDARRPSWVLGGNYERVQRWPAYDLTSGIALTFDVPRLQGLTYYVAGSPEGLHRIMGVDWTFGGLGYEYAAGANHLILSGDPTFGEENRHELAHVLLGPLLTAGLTHSLMGEGIAAWLGGSVGRTFPELLAEYADYLEAYPEITVDSILKANDPDKGGRVHYQFLQLRKICLSNFRSSSIISQKSS